MQKSQFQHPNNGLPENAYRPLDKGETYIPVIPAEKQIAEVTLRSLFGGIIMAIIFSGAAAFFGLKVGQVFETTIPIAIIAVGMSGLFPRKSTILENVITTSVGSSASYVVPGIIFTLPAIFILGLNVSFFKIAASAFLGGSLGLLFLIMFRRYFVKDMHGELPFPEGTATTEILVSSNKGGKEAKILFFSMIVGAFYDFCVYTLHYLNETFSTTVFSWGKAMADKTKAIFSVNLTSAIFGLGYIVGIRYAAIICAGSFLSFLVLIPLFACFGSAALQGIHDPNICTTVTLSANEIFSRYIRLIGIGAIACAGLIGILKTSKIIKDAIRLGIKEIFTTTTKYSSEEIKLRTDKDIHMRIVLGIMVSLLIVLFIYFALVVVKGEVHIWELGLIALAIVFFIIFLFTPVSARAIAIVGTNPVSGMTLMALIITSIILVKSGLTNTTGIVAALIIGAVVCTGLSAAGAFVTDLKVGYWIGATPAQQERFKFLGTLVSALTVSAVVILLNQTYGFVITPSHSDALVAPQANAMAAVIKTLMSNSQIPWILYGAGIMIAIVCEMCGIPPLAFAMGMYLPIDLNIPLLIGGFVAFMVAKSTKDQVVKSGRQNRGTLIASGLMAGGAMIGVIGAIIKYFKIDQTNIMTKITYSLTPNANNTIVSLIVYLLLIIFVYIFACNTKSKK